MADGPVHTALTVGRAKNWGPADWHAGGAVGEIHGRLVRAAQGASLRGGGREDRRGRGQGQGEDGGTGQGS